MQAKSIKGNSPEEIQNALRESTADGFKPTLAILFVSVKMDRDAVCNILQEHDIDIMGATSCGEFIEGHQSEGEAVSMLLDMDRDAYTILYEDIGDRELVDVGTKLARDGSAQFANPGFILCSTFFSAEGKILNGPTLMQSMEDVVGVDVHIYGGMAGDDTTFAGTYVFTHDNSSDNGIVALVVDEDKISLQGMAISGWNGLGIKRTVTKCEDGWICEIDGRPALEMYLKYLGKGPVLVDDDFELAKIVGFDHPFQFEDAGDPVMRTPMTIDRDKNAIKLDFDVAEGTRFRFSVPPDLDIVDNIVAGANEIIDASQSDAKALLVFSCAGRLSALGPLTKLENESLSEVWNTPMAGFYTYGEYGTTKDRGQEFHSTTCCWVAIKEV
jgi:hypothetical protein